MVLIKVITYIILLNSTLCFCSLKEKDTNIRSSNIIEKSIIHRLPHKNRYLFRYGIDFEVKINDENTEKSGLKYEDVNLVPSEFMELSELDYLVEIFATSVQGIWRDENWGESPVNTYPAGLTLDVKFKNDGKQPAITKGIWFYILNKASNIMCSSFDIFKNELFKEKHCINMKHNDNTERVICTNHDDTLCTDTLVCWKRMLPCFSFGLSENIHQSGILGKLPLDSFINSSYKSIGFKMKKISGLSAKDRDLVSSESRIESKIVFTLFLESVLKGENRIQILSNINLNNENEWNLWSFHKLGGSPTMNKLCPPVSESKLYIYIGDNNGTVNEIAHDNDSICRITHLEKYSLKRGEFQETSNNYGLLYLDLDLKKISNNSSCLNFNFRFFQNYCNINVFKNINSFTSPAIYSNKESNYGSIGIDKYYSKESDIYVRRFYTNTIDDFGRIHSVWTHGSLVMYLSNREISNKNVTFCHWEKIPEFINIWFHKTRVLYSSKQEIIDIYEDLKREDVTVLKSNRAIKYIGLNVNNSDGNGVLVNFCLELPPGMNLAIIFYLDKSFRPLFYYGPKSQRGQIPPPSVTLYNIGKDETKTHTVIHNLHIVPVILVDHTMTFNVIATTSAFIIFGLIITSKFIQLNEKNTT